MIGSTEPQVGLVGYDVNLGYGTITKVNPGVGFTANFGDNKNREYDCNGYCGYYRMWYWDNSLFIDEPLMPNDVKHSIKVEGYKWISSYVDKIFETAKNK